MIQEMMDRPAPKTLLDHIRLLALDVDGVLTDGGMYFGGTGELFKRFHIQDGLALTLMPSLDVTVAIITGRSSEIVSARMKDLRISHVFQGVKRKSDVLSQLTQELGLSMNQVLYMGDDLPDLKAMLLAGVSVAPHDAHEVARRAATWVTKAKGGAGAVREVCDAIAHAKGRYEEWVHRFETQDGL